MEQYYELESSDPEELQSASLTHYYRGDSAVGFRLAEKAYRLAPEDKGAHFEPTLPTRSASNVKYWASIRSIEWPRFNH